MEYHNVVRTSIRVLYNNSRTAEMVDGNLSDTFVVSTGVIQGDVLAPFLFVILVDLPSGKGHLRHWLRSHDTSTPIQTSSCHCAEGPRFFSDDIPCLSLRHHRRRHNVLEPLLQPKVSGLSSVPPRHILYDLKQDELQSPACTPVV